MLQLQQQQQFQQQQQQQQQAFLRKQDILKRQTQNISYQQEFNKKVEREKVNDNIIRESFAPDIHKATNQAHNHTENEYLELEEGVSARFEYERSLIQNDKNKENDTFMESYKNKSSNNNVKYQGEFKNINTTAQIWDKRIPLLVQNANTKDSQCSFNGDQRKERNQEKQGNLKEVKNYEKNQKQKEEEEEEDEEQCKFNENSICEEIKDTFQSSHFNRQQYEQLVILLEFEREKNEGIEKELRELRKLSSILQSDSFKQRQDIQREVDEKEQLKKLYHQVVIQFEETQKEKVLFVQQNRELMRDANKLFEDNRKLLRRDKEISEENLKLKKMIAEEQKMQKHPQEIQDQLKEGEDKENRGQNSFNQANNQKSNKSKERYQQNSQLSFTDDLMNIMGSNTVQGLYSKALDLVQYKKQASQFIDCVREMVEKLAPQGYQEEQGDKLSLKQIWSFLKKLMERHIELKIELQDIKKQLHDQQKTRQRSHENVNDISQYEIKYNQVLKEKCEENSNLAHNSVKSAYSTIKDSPQLPYEQQLQKQDILLKKRSKSPLNSTLNTSNQSSSRRIQKQNKSMSFNDQAELSCNNNLNTSNHHHQNSYLQEYQISKTPFDNKLFYNSSCVSPNSVGIQRGTPKHRSILADFSPFQSKNRRKSQVY